MTYPFIDGLLPSTESDLKMFDECYSQAVSISAAFKDLDDNPKYVTWDAELETWLRHRAAVIDEDGRAEYFPWQLYETLGLRWLDGYNYAQKTGDCCSMGHKNSLKRSNLTNAKRTSRDAPEIAASMTYALARGNGRVSFGSGLNLNPMSKWAAQKGNFLTSDFGRYDTGGYVRKYRPGSEQDKNALKYQSVILYLPSATFDHVFLMCSAGIGINMGTGTYPTGSSVNSEGIGVPSSWKNGGHSMAWVATMVSPSGRRYLYLENSHGNRYVADKYHAKPQSGCWIDEAMFKKIAASGFRFGTWYGNIGEMG
jgi:hypothetical protein